MSDRVILSHAGKQHSYHVAKSLLALGRLERFYTSSYITSPTLQNYILRRNNQFWIRRFEPGLDGTHVESNWRFEWREMIYSKLYGQSLKTINAVYDRDVAFDRYMAKRMSRLPGSVFWGFQGSCRESIAAARASGKRAICELATAHAPAAKKILGEERELHPEWADSFDNLEFPESYYRRLCEEPEQADIVIGASQFTLRTLRDSGIAEAKLRYLPLGFDADRVPYEPRQRSLTRPLRLLYAGRITQRKGIKYLLEAMKQLGTQGPELHLVGHVQGSGNALKPYHSLFVRHAPVSQQEMFRAYREYDALVLPSVFEGFGLVVVEALAAGLPVITTPNTIGPELIRDGVNGYIVPVRDPNAIAEAIARLSSKTATELDEMSREARLSALEYSWDAYTRRLDQMMQSL